jgi:serine/threonine-protein kinase
MPLAPGVRLGIFEILGPLGAGGMGEVYRARDGRLGRDVAIKILPEDLARDPARIARFEREGRLLAALNHPGIAAIYGAEESDAVRYIVLELVPGETLSERLARGGLSLRESLEIGRQIADALDGAHQKGIIHRDLKPTNVKITPEGKVKVLDFGLAKAAAPPPIGDASQTPTLVADQTRPGVILGTIEFMSPEQARGHELDRRTDIWSFGCILFELLSGRRAFPGETLSDVFAAILRAEPDWAALPPTTPPRVRELLERCLQKDPGNRLRDAGDARMEIESSLAELSAPRSASQARPAAEAPRRRGLILITVAVVVVAAAAAWLLLRRPRPPSSAGERSLVVLPSRDLSGTPGGQLVGDGIVEILSARLGQVPGLEVVTPVAAVAASDAQSDPLQAARSVGARFALKSSLMRSGDQVRITYSVWNVASRSQVAGGTVDGASSDLFGIQDRLADSVTVALKLKDSGRKTPTPTGLETAAAQEKYLKAIGDLQRYDKAPSVEDAIRLLESLNAENPAAPLVHAGLGRAYLHKFELTNDRAWADRAIAEAESARKLDPKLAAVDVTLGETRLATGQTARAEEAFRRALSFDPGNAEALVGLGQARDAAGDAAGAEASFRKAIELRPNFFGAYSQLGALFFERGRYADAEKIFERLTRLTPDSYSAFSNLGGSRTMNCDFRGAVEAYRRALELRPGHASAASNLGMNQLWSGQNAEALGSLRRAAELGPKNYKIWGNLGDGYRINGREKEAKEAYATSVSLAREQLRVNPGDAAAHSWVAVGLARTGQLAAAAEETRKALAAEGTDPNVMMDAALVALLSGRRSEAIAWIDRAVRAGYCRSIVAIQPDFIELRADAKFRAIVAEPRTSGGL